MYKLLLCFALLFCVTGVAHAEQITDFYAVLDVQQDGTVLLTETITYDFGETERHGIYRVLQQRHPQKETVWYKNRSIAIEVLDVQKDGQFEPYQVVEKKTEVEVKIGSAEVTVSGSHTYTLHFKLEGALSYGTQGAELYYNATGNNWLVPIENATVVVTDATGQLLRETRTCYQGLYGDTARCTMGTQTATSSTFTTGLLIPGTGLTIAQELNADQVAVLINEEVFVNWILNIFGCIWIIGLSVWAYRFRTAFKTNKPVIAQYEPYEGVLPMYTGVLFDGTLDPRDITAGIVYLAEQGFIKIRKTEEKVLWVFNTSDYELTLLRTATQDIPESLKLILSFLFFKQEIIGATIKTSSLKKETLINQQFLSNLKKITGASLAEDGFIFNEPFMKLGAKIGTLFVAVTIGLLIFSFLISSVFLFGITLLSLVLIVLALWRRWSAKGYEAKNHLKGFKLFLSVTEKERYTFFNAPEKSPEQFMEYLPYAIAFGVEKEWSKVFEGITIANPSWYDGGATGVFSATSFASDIGAFSSSFAASSGVSGSSGGGSSGGGGGGGGGGSW